MIISIFGSSSPLPESMIYQETLQLGRKLALHEHVVLNGGYMGLMEAVSQGAAEAGGRVIGVTCDEIEKWRPIKPNRWINQEVRFITILERLNYLVSQCDIAIALPGGIGTLTEISLTWNLLVTESITNKPIWLVGAGWQAIINVFKDKMKAHVTTKQSEYIVFYDNISQVINNL